jgi:hypothetical protein
MSIIEERLPWLETFQLERGSHSPDGRACIMEAAAYIAGEPWSDHPKCVSPAIGAFLRSWNDSLSDEDRQILKPYVTKVIGTRGTKAQEEKRAWLAMDWLARECAPAFLRLAGLTEHAVALEGLAALTTTRHVQAAQPKLDAAGTAAGAAVWAAAAGAAARDAAWVAVWAAAAGAAARDAAKDAAWAAAWAAAAGAAARDAARDAAWAAAWAAAGATAAGAAARTARAALRPTVKQLQQSALLLLDRMIEA